MAVRRAARVRRRAWEGRLSCGGVKTIPSSLDLNDQRLGRQTTGTVPSEIHPWSTQTWSGQSADSTLIRPGWAVMVLVRPWNSTVKVRGAERLSKSISRIKTPS